MKIAVIGPGAMGCLLAALLSEGNDVCLLDHNRERAALIEQQGLIVEDGGRRIYQNFQITDDPYRFEGDAELILLCVKSTAVSQALQSARILGRKKSLVIALQNGIGHLALLAEQSGDLIPVLGVTSQGATLIGPGHVLHKGRGPTTIGIPPAATKPSKEITSKLKEVATILTVAGIETATEDNIFKQVWRKLLINVGINALTAIHDCPNGALLEDPDTLEVMRKAILEGKMVAEKSGIVIDGDPVQAAIEVCRATSGNISSMLQDVRASRATEIDAINGALLRKGVGYGIAMPVNRELVRKIREIEGSYRDFS